jgi:predicted nucleotidyltransferase
LGIDVSSFAERGVLLVAYLSRLWRANISAKRSSGLSLETLVIFRKCSCEGRLPNNHERAELSASSGVAVMGHKVEIFDRRSGVRSTDIVDSICYMSDNELLLQRLRDDARTAENLHEESRRLLVSATRAGAAAGLTQRQISEAIGRSQPEVSRLIRFHGRSRLGRRLTRDRSAVLSTLADAGVRNVRVFGSVARGEDTDESDFDLLVDLPDDIGLFTLGRLESQLTELLDTKVDLVPAAGLRANLRDRVLAEAILL